MTSVKGIVRFYLASVEPLELYQSPVNFDPRSPAFPISYPSGYAKELSKELGMYHTIGQAEDTWSLNEGRVSDETFLQQCERVIQEREAMLKYELARFENGLLVISFDTPDRIQHMFWRYYDPEQPLYDAEQAKKYQNVFPRLYQTMDRILGDAMASISEDTTLIVLSDHGFSNFRTAVHTNAWLKEQGYLVFKPTAKTGEMSEFFDGVDWSKSKAYAAGLSGIFVNLQGRERNGSVSPSELRAVQDEISRKLLGWVDPKTSTPIVHKVYRMDEVYEGPYTDRAPDLMVAFEEGYRSSWQTALGSTPTVLMEPNAKRWSGDHCVEPSFVPGVFLSNRKINTETPRIIDIAPTILKLFGIEPPETVDGKSLL
jgi:predicted AlkP superfamily phosphohydrolase/phosphomutase